MSRSSFSIVFLLVVACDGDGRLNKTTVPSNYDSTPAERVNKDAPGIVLESAKPVDPATPPEVAALTYLGDRAVSGITFSKLHNTGSGVIIASFGREVAGLPVFRDEVRVAMKQNKELVAIVGALSNQGNDHPVFTLPAADALEHAFNDLTGRFGASFSEVASPIGSEQRFALDNGDDVHMPIPARVKRVLFPLSTGLEAAYYIELKAGLSGAKDADYFSYVVAADDGRLLYRNNLSADASYRLWADANHVPFDGPEGKSTPHPTGLADRFQFPFVASSLHTLENFPFSRNDPWLPANATKTDGNNAKAYADLAQPDGFSNGDIMATTTAAGVFDRAYNPALAPDVNETQVMAAVTSLFYLNNFFHDWYYDAGFDEAAGNAQNNNFGRGGLQNDAILAEGQDFSGTNNANMQTPSDGANPVMQMYVFSAISSAKVTVTAPAAIAGDKVAAAASFGPGAFSISGTVVKVDDGVGTVTDGCDAPFDNAAALNGKIAIVLRGSCSFAQKVASAQAAGAIGVIVANNVAGDPQTMGNSNTTTNITIPSVLVTQATGAAIMNSTATVTASLIRGAAPDRDGTIDNLIVAHEWAHYLANRLIGDGNGLFTNMGGGLGEGWSDFSSMLLSVREADKTKPNNANFGGVYAMAGYTSSGADNNGYYFGIRRYPYSTSLNKNPLTFKHIEEGVALPANVPVAFGEDGNGNSEVHSTGEVWANMLWEAYAGLLNDPRYTFAQAQQRMKEYFVASLKLTPVYPTLLEARDALYAAAIARDMDDYAVFAKAFAKRGAGLRAVGPNRYSNDNSPVTESFDYGNDVAVVEAVLTETDAVCEPDQVLDSGETAEITVTVKNIGLGALTQTKATITTEQEGVTIENDGIIEFANTEPLKTASGKVTVKLDGVTDITTIDFDIKVEDPELAVPLGLGRVLKIRSNYQNVEAAATKDDVESDLTAWTVSHDAALADVDFERVTTDAVSHQWFGANAESTADVFLTSPVLEVADEGSLSFTFKHAYAFEATRRQAFDGGVIELQEGSGAWKDIGSKAVPSYNLTLDPEGTNPLAGQKAYAGKSTGYPELKPVTVNLGEAYLGKKVRVRFRMGADEAGSSVGWFIDDIEFQGIKNKPFTTIIPQPASCNAGPVANAGKDQTVSELTQVTLEGSGTTETGGELSYAWKQTAGPKVALSDAASATPTFTAPDVGAKTVLAFELTVSDVTGTSPASKVEITVKDSVKTIEPQTQNLNPTGCGCRSSEPGDALLLVFAGALLLLRRRRQG
jgi:MYXO-CTERM domain-containing protein